MAPLQGTGLGVGEVEMKFTLSIALVPAPAFLGSLARGSADISYAGKLAWSLVVYLIKQFQRYLFHVLLYDSMRHSLTST